VACTGARSEFNVIRFTIKRVVKTRWNINRCCSQSSSFDAEYYGRFWAAFDVPRHLWHFSQKSIKKLFSREEMKVVDIRPMKFDAFYVSLLSEKYRHGKMNPLKAFYIGLRSNLKAIQTKQYSSLIYIIKNA
jgi:hypothetical protein